jgi:hypothetical protein
MTKEVLKLKFEQGKLSKQELFEFFSQNICIPKGENRHPDADELHLYIENCTEDFRLLQFDNTLDNWFATDLTTDIRFKIASTEPIYEYLWLDLRTPDDFYCPTSKYMTEDEASAYFNPSETYFKVLETKRVRQ